MEFLKIIFLALIQGATEFLPISSSGHLVLLEHFFKIQEPLILIIILHFGSLLAISLFFFKDIKKIFSPLQKELILKILVASLPLMLVPLFSRTVEKTFSSINTVIFGFLLTAIFLLVTKFLKTFRKSISDYSYSDAFLIGTSQVLSVFPGISRSGLTIITALILKSKPEDAFKFSFFLSLVAIAGATLLKFKYIISYQNLSSFFLLMVFLFSFIFSYLSLIILKKIILKNKLYYFSIYLIILVLFLLFLI